jgi:hypothetical protein
MLHPHSGLAIGEVFGLKMAIVYVRIIAIPGTFAG